MPSTLDELTLKLPPDIRPRLAALDVWGQTLDRTAQAYASEIQQAVSTMLVAAAQFDERWQLFCREVLDGRSEEVQRLRDAFLSEFEDWLRLLGETRDRVRFAERVAQRTLPEAAQLENEANTLQSKLKKLSSRWQTVEDLEDLAAESIAISAEKLEAVSRKYGYPQAWYDDDSSDHVLTPSPAEFPAGLREPR